MGLFGFMAALDTVAQLADAKNVDELGNKLLGKFDDAVNSFGNLADNIARAPEHALKAVENGIETVNKQGDRISQVTETAKNEAAKIIDVAKS